MKKNLPLLTIVFAVIFATGLQAMQTTTLTKEDLLTMIEDEKQIELLEIQNDTLTPEDVDRIFKLSDRAKKELLLIIYTAISEADAEELRDNLRHDIWDEQDKKDSDTNKINRLKARMALAIVDEDKYHYNYHQLSEHVQNKELLTLLDKKGIVGTWRSNSTLQNIARDFYAILYDSIQSEKMKKGITLPKDLPKKGFSREKKEKRPALK